MSPAMAVRSSVAAPPVLVTVRPVAPILPPEAIVTDVVARSIVTPPLAVTAKRSVVVPSAVTTTLPAPATVFPVRIDAAAVRATPPFTVVATAEPFEASSSVPVKVTLWFTRTLLSASPLMLLTFTAASAVPIVTARAPVPVLLTVSPATLVAAAVIVNPSPTVTTAPSSVPVKVPVPSKAAVVVVASRPLRSAASDECKAVT